MNPSRDCPICFQLPEKKIYQCRAGHVICHLCLSKMSGNKCPTCQVSYGSTKIRCLFMESQLDALEFKCKFTGCDQLIKRGELSNHAKACSFNSDTVPLCEQLGLDGCKFRIGKELSRAEIIAHFESLHGENIRLRPSGAWSAFSGQDLMNQFNNIKNKAGAEKSQQVKILRMISFGKFETSPLFLLICQLNVPLGFLSLVAINVWETASQHSQMYNTEFQIYKALSPTSTSSSTAASGTNIFPIGGFMKVCSLDESYHILKASPLSVSLPLLANSGWGQDERDLLYVRISETKPVFRGVPVFEYKRKRIDLDMNYVNWHHIVE